MPDRSLTILQLTHQGGPAGSTQSIFGLSQHLARRGHRVVVGCREDTLLAAADDHAVAAAGEVLTQAEDGLCRAGGTALVRQLQDGEGPVWHRPKVVIRRLRRGTR